MEIEMSSRQKFDGTVRLVRWLRRQGKENPAMKDSAILFLNRLSPDFFAAVCQAIEPGGYKARPFSVEQINEGKFENSVPRSVLIRDHLKGAIWRKDLRKRGYPFFPGTNYHNWRFG